MASFSKIIFAGFAALAAARPLAVDRRDVTSIVTETSWSTVNVMATLWVDPNGKPVKTDIPSVVVSQATTTAAAAAVVAETTTPAAVTTTTPPPPPTTTTSSAVVTTPAQFYTTPAAEPAPVATTTTTTSDAPAATVNNAGSSGTELSGKAVSASATNNCEGEGDACEGDITNWGGGLGACGWDVNTASDMQIALPVGFMGSQSNGNPYCGRSLTIMNPNTGATTQATVGDKCMGCQGRSIDLTEALFNAIGGGCDGRCSGFEWWFN